MDIAQHYQDNRIKLIKRLTFRTGTEWAAQDVLHDAYERAIRYIKSFNGDNFDKWFNTILNNTLREYKNNAKGFATSSFEEDENEGTACPHIPNTTVNEIEELINTKSIAQIEVLNLWFLQEYSAKDISSITNHSHSSCRQIIKRFRDELKEIYG
jgi:RNA polymerase sigma factor (sigma-70 family)